MSHSESSALREKVEAWLEVLDETNHYELLGLLEISDDAAIQGAFHEFAEAFHPDCHRTEAPDVREGVTRIFKRGAEAYRILRGAKSRAAYDLDLAKSRAEHQPEGTAPGSQRVKSLDQLCTSAAGRLHARQAERAITDGKLGQAIQLLQKAVFAEENNQPLIDRLEALRAMHALAGD